MKKTNTIEKDTEEAKIVNKNENCNVFTAPVYGASFPLPGSHVTINQFYGGKKPKEFVEEGRVESEEDREKRKIEVLKSITDRFCFDEKQLGYDNQKRHLTNERVAILFRRCFGMGGAYPTQANRLIQEQLWALLIDERNQCTKEADEDFFRQTVLNILGHFRLNEILIGGKNDLLQVVFQGANTNLAKNIERGIPTSFPDSTDDMIDFYIGKLMDGDF